MYNRMMQIIHKWTLHN